jgi:hypothetical protein
MTKADKQADKITALERELAEIKAVQDKAKPIDFEAERIAAAKYVDEMRQLSERRMSLAMPPSAVRYFADGVTAADCADLRRASHSPIGPSPMSPSSPPVSGARRGVAGSGTGWAHSAPLGPPPGVAQADRLMDAQDAKDRAELIRQEAQQRALAKLAKQTEALAKLVEKK